MLRARRLLSWGFWLAFGILTIPVAAYALQNGPEPSKTTEVGKDIPSPSRVTSANVTKIEPLRTDATEPKKAQVLERIRIGRLELRRNHNVDLDADSPMRFDPMEMVRAARHLVPKPAVTLTFDLHWRDRLKKD